MKHTLKAGDLVVCVKTDDCDCGKPKCSNRKETTVGMAYIVSETLIEDRLWIKLDGVSFPEDECHEADWLDACDFVPLNLTMVPRSKT